METYNNDTVENIDALLNSLDVFDYDENEISEATPFETPIEVSVPETDASCPFSDVMDSVMDPEVKRKPHFFYSILNDRVEEVLMPTEEEAEKASTRVTDTLRPAIRLKVENINRKYGRGKMTKAHAAEILDLKIKEAKALAKMNKISIISGTQCPTESLESNYQQMVKAKLENKTKVIVDLARRLLEAADKEDKGANAYVQ